VHTILDVIRRGDTLCRGDRPCDSDNVDPEECYATNNIETSICYAIEEMGIVMVCAVMGENRPKKGTKGRVRLLKNGRVAAVYMRMVDKQQTNIVGCCNGNWKDLSDRVDKTILPVLQLGPSPAAHHPAMPVGPTSADYQYAVGENRQTMSVGPSSSGEQVGDNQANSGTNQRRVAVGPTSGDEQGDDQANSGTNQRRVDNVKDEQRSGSGIGPYIGPYFG